MPTFSTSIAGPPGVALNPLLDLASIDHSIQQTQGNALALQGTQQDLTNQANLRSLAPQLASGDPNAMAQAATLGPQGVGALNAVDAMNTSRRSNLGAYAGMVGNFAGAVSALPADQQASAYSVGRQQLTAAGVPDAMLPQSHPGTSALLALRNSMIPAADQVKMNADYPRFDGGASGGPMGLPVGGGILPPSGAGAGGGAGGVSGSQADTGDDGVINGLAGSESSNRPGIVNSQGYSGLFQFGTKRLGELGMYQPASGEDPNGNQWKGTFAIPGFPGVQTYSQFLTNGPAQRAAMHVHVADIHNAINQTPGADQFSPDGLIAVAHLGGVDGMQKFVAGQNGTGPAYNPGDNPRAPGGGTHLIDYYNRYSQLGRGQLAADHGHPDGPIPGYVPPNVIPVKSTPLPPPQQTASAANSAGMPATATDASPAGPPSGPLDIGPTGQLVVPPGEGGTAPAPAAPSAPPGLMPSQAPRSIPNQNPLMSLAGPIPTGQLPQNGLLASVSGPASGSVQASPSNGLPPNRPGMIMGTKGGLPIPVNGQPGMVQGYDPTTRQVGVMAAPGAVNTGRLLRVPNPQGGSDLVSPSGQTVATVGPDLAARQGEAYKADIPTQREMIGSVQGAQSQMMRQNEMADIAQGLQQTGPTGPLMAKAAVFLESLGVAPANVQKLTGMSSGTAAQEFMKLGITASGAATKNDLGSNAGVQAMNLYQQANPNYSLLPDANKRVTNMGRVGLQSVIDYNQGGLDHFSQNEQAHLTDPSAQYQPLTQYNARWARQANPLVYAGAMGVLNGDPIEKWGARLNPAQQQQAREIATRVDPNAGQPAQQPQPAQQAQPASSAAAGGVAPPAAAIAHLQANPNLAAAFDQKYGAGSSARVIGR